MNPFRLAPLIDFRSTDTTVTLTLRSLLTDALNTRTLALTGAELDAGLSARFHGAKVQDAFPTLTAEEREFLLTGSTEAEWEQLGRELEEFEARAGLTEGDCN